MFAEASPTNVNRSVNAVPSVDPHSNWTFTIFGRLATLLLERVFIHEDLFKAAMRRQRQPSRWRVRPDVPSGCPEIGLSNRTFETKAYRGAAFAQRKCLKLATNFVAINGRLCRIPDMLLGPRPALRSNRSANQQTSPARIDFPSALPFTHRSSVHRGVARPVDVKEVERLAEGAPVVRLGSVHEEAHRRVSLEYVVHYWLAIIPPVYLLTVQDSSHVEDISRSICRP